MNQSVLILVGIAAIGGGFIAYNAIKGTISPQEQAKQEAKEVAIAYMEASTKCDWKKMDSMRVYPLSEAKKTCDKTIRMSSGQEISINQFNISVEKVDYSREKDPKFDPEGKIESAIVLPSITYQGKPAGIGMPNLIMMTRNPDLGGKWLVMSP